MKVKKVGNQSREDSQIVKSDSIDENIVDHTKGAEKINTSKQIAFVALSIIGILAIIGTIYYLWVFNHDSTILKSESDLRIKELEKKEQELLKREEEIKLSRNDNPLTIVERIFTSFTSENNKSNSDISHYYADYVHYYSWKNAYKPKLLSDKKNFFKKWDIFEINTSDVSFIQVNTNIVECNYDKEFSCENFSNGKKYSGKVRAKLVFEKINDEWLITRESDEKIYYTNKNF